MAWWTCIPVNRRARRRRRAEEPQATATTGRVASEAAPPVEDVAGTDDAERELGLSVREVEVARRWWAEAEALARG